MKSLSEWGKGVFDFPRWSAAWLTALRFNCAAAKAISLCAILSAVIPAKAIILFGSGDPNQNTTPPTGALAGSGWELQGNWSFYLGTPIGPHHFITASHLGGTVGQVFSFQGKDYTTISTSVDSASDLQIWEILGTFPAWAELYNGPTETGLDLVVFGRGTTRGGEVRVSDQLKGWFWGNSDTRRRWGVNRVSSISADTAHPGSELPQLLVAAFNSNATADEAHLGAGDSGGGVFIKQGTEWRLAGINYSVEGPYNTSNTGPGFFGAIFDEGGLFQGGEGKWSAIIDLPTQQPGNFYASRIKARLSWIQSVLAAPLTTVLLEASEVAGPYNPVAGANIDTAAKTIRIPITANNRFYQIWGEGQPEITSAVLSGGTLVLRYTQTF